MQMKESCEVFTFDEVIRTLKTNIKLNELLKNSKTNITFDDILKKYDIYGKCRR